MSLASSAIGTVDTSEALEVGQGPAADGYGLYGDVFVTNDRNNDQPRTVRTGHTVGGTCVARGCEDLAEVVLTVAIGISFGPGPRAGIDAGARRTYRGAVESVDDIDGGDAARRSVARNAIERIDRAVDDVRLVFGRAATVSVIVEGATPTADAVVRADLHLTGGPEDRFAGCGVEAVRLSTEESPGHHIMPAGQRTDAGGGLGTDFARRVAQDAGEQPVEVALELNIQSVIRIASRSDLDLFDFTGRDPVVCAPVPGPLDSQIGVSGQLGDAGQRHSVGGVLGLPPAVE